MTMKSLNAVIRSYQACNELDCDKCPYYSEDGCDRDSRDDDSLYLLKEYRDRQNDLEKELSYWRKQNDIVVNLVTILKAQKENILCKDCKFYDEDVWVQSPMPLIVAHHRCRKWGNGCQTEPEGFCYMGEKK